MLDFSSFYFYEAGLEGRISEPVSTGCLFSQGRRDLAKLEAALIEEACLSHVVSRRSGFPVRLGLAAELLGARASEAARVRIS